MAWNEDHLAAFKKTFEVENQVWQGKAPRAWGKDFVPCSILQKLPQGVQSRNQLRAFCCENASNSELCFLVVMAWGGARLNNAQNAWNCKDRWLSALAEIQTQDRLEAYGNLYGLSNSRNFLGVGPAYYTKLLFFVRQRQDAYIMDQWTVKSMQLLTGEACPHLNRSVYKNAETFTETFTVCKRKNGVAQYQHYCNQIEALASLIGVEPQEIEERLFSSGGRNAGPWREHVKQHWAPIRN